MAQDYTEQGQDYYEERYRERVLHALLQRAAKLGTQMVPLHNRPENVIPYQSLGMSFLRGASLRADHEDVPTTLSIKYGTILNSSFPCHVEVLLHIGLVVHALDVNLGRVNLL